MHEEDDDPFDSYTVVVNDEEQYSIWPTEKAMPNGWRAAGRQGSKQECLDHIAEVWTDMRPLSLRRTMEEWARNPPPAVPLIDPDPPGMPSLVDRLCASDQPVSFTCRPERTAKALAQRIELGHVHIKFTGTRGGTELGVRLDPHASDWSGADFERGVGAVRLVGTLTLDYEKVRCLATIDVATLDGTGKLEKSHDTEPAAA
jgi:uncharacterized protein YbdZ (MbtH family)